MKCTNRPEPRSGVYGWEHLRRIRQDLLAHCIDMADRFGDCVSYRLGASKVFQFTHPDQIREVLVSQHDRFHKPGRCGNVYRGWHGKGLLLNEGQAWAEQRQLVLLTTPILPPAWCPTATRRKLRSVMRSLEVLVDEIIDKQQPSGARRNGLLSEIFAHRDDLATRRITALNLLLGSETTATSLTWAAYLLAQHPSVQESARDKAGHWLPDGASMETDSPRLEFIEAILKETMRLYPPAYLLTREAVKRVRIGNWWIEPGSQVHLPLYVTHRDPRWFSRPNEFQPARFASHSATLRPFSYLPFGAGPRVCIGKRLAMMTGVLVLASLIRSCRLSLKPAQDPPELKALISLHPTGGMELAVERYESIQAVIMTSKRP